MAGHQETSGNVFAAACGGLQPGPPHVVSTIPASGATNVAPDAAITATFDIPIAPASVTATTFVVRDASGAAVAGQASASGAVATFTPGAPLAASATFQATLSTGIMAKNGKALAAPVGWFFTTAGTSPQTPGVPGGVSITAGDTATTVSWTAVAGATSYNLYWSNSAGVSKANHLGVLTAAAPQANHSGLTNGTTYYYVVTALNSVGESAESAEVSATPSQPGSLPAPTGLSAAPQDDAVQLTWTASANATSYNLYWSTNAAVSKASGSPIIGVTSGYLHSGLTNGVAYSWVVTAASGASESAESAVVHATPASTTAPLVRAAQPANGDLGVPVGRPITVTFSKPMLASSLTGSTVTLSAGAAPVAASVSASGSTATLTPSAPLSVGTTYTVTVAAGVSDLAGNLLAAPFSSMFTTQPAAPTGLSGIFGNSAVTLTWNPAAGATSYQAYRGQQAGGPYFRIGGMATTTFTDNLSSNGNVIYFVVTAISAQGESAFSNELSGQASSSNPFAPGFVFDQGASSIQAIGLDGQVVLSWGNSGPPTTSYQVLSSLTPGGPYAPAGSPTTDFGTVLRGLSNGIRLYFVVQGLGNGNLVSVYSDEVSAVPNAGGPAAPVISSAVPGRGWARVTWGAVSGAASYLVQRSLTPAGRYQHLAVVAGATTWDDLDSLVPGTRYYVVSALDGNGVQGPLSAEVPAATGNTLRPPPLVLNAVASHNLVDLSTPFLGNLGFTYSFNRGTTSGTWPTSIPVGGSGLTATDNTAVDGTTYYYIVTSTNGTASTDSAEVAVTPGNTAPDAPSNLVGYASNGAVTLQWDAVANAPSYQVQSASTCGGSFFTLGTTPVPAFLNSGSSCYKVISVRGNLQSAPSATLAITPNAARPQAPAPFLDAGFRQARLSWPAISGATSYNIRRSINGGSWTQIATTPNLGYFDNSAINGATYGVSAVNASGEGAWQPFVGPVVFTTGAPAAPVVTAHAGDGSLSFNWDPVPGARSYTTCVSPTPGGPYNCALASSPTVDALSANFLQASNGTPVYFIVRANPDLSDSSASHSDWSAEVSATPSASLLGQAYATATAGASQVMLTWPAVIGATGYRVYRIDEAGQAALAFTPATAGVADSGLPAGVPWTYAVSAMNGSIEAAWTLAIPSSGPLVPEPVTPNSSNPQAPTVTGVAGNGVVNLKWNPIPGALGYRVYSARTPTGPFVQVVSSVANPSAQAVATNGVLTYFSVRAYNGHNGAFGDGDGGSNYSTPVGLTASAASPPALSFTPTAGNGEVALFWGAVAGASGYHVYRLNGSPAAWKLIGSPTSAPYHDYGLVNDVSITYAVSAVVGGVDQGWSQEQAITPSAALPGVPSNLVARAGLGKLTLTWDPVPAASYYLVYCSLTAGNATFVVANTSDPIYTGTYTNGTPQYCYVAAGNATGSGSFSNEAHATPSAALPAAPALATPVAGSQSISLSWNTVSGATSYLVYRRAPGGVWTLVGGPVSHAFVDRGLSAAVSYAYSIAAVNGSGSGSWSTEASGTPTQ